MTIENDEIMTMAKDEIKKGEKEKKCINVICIKIRFFSLFFSQCIYLYPLELTMLYIYKKTSGSGCCMLFLVFYRKTRLSSSAIYSFFCYDVRRTIQHRYIERQEMMNRKRASKREIGNKRKLITVMLYPSIHNAFEIRKKTEFVQHSIYSRCV